MVFITSEPWLAKAKQICRVAKVKGSLIIGDKMVTKAIQEMNPPVTVLIVAADEGCGNHVAEATKYNILILSLTTRSEVEKVVGYASVSSCVFSFEDDEELLLELLQLR